jgi:hypothetical protein
MYSLPSLALPMLLPTAYFHVVVYPLLTYPSLICCLDCPDRSSELYPTMTFRRTDVPVSLSELRCNDILHLVRLVYMKCWMTGGRRSHQ